MLVGCQPGPKRLKSLERWVPKGSTLVHMEGPLPCNTFYPHSSQGYQDMTLGFTIHESTMEENRRGHSIHLWAPERAQIPIQDYKSTILMNTLKIKFLGIRFLRIALKSQHRLAGVVLQNRQEIDLLIPGQGGTWAILNEMCCFWVNKVKESLS